MIAPLITLLRVKEFHSLDQVARFLSLLLLFLFVVSTVALEVATIPGNLMFVDDALHFEIHWPESLRYTYRLRQARNFGSDFNRTFDNIQLVQADPEEACQDLNNDVRDTVVLVLRGGCSFLSKTTIAERAGAVAVIIADNDETNDMSMIDMVDDNSERKVDIPSTFLMGKDGAMIRQHLRYTGSEYAIITIPVNLTGKPVAEAKRPPWSLCDWIGGPYKCVFCNRPASDPEGSKQLEKFQVDLADGSVCDDYNYNL